MKSNYIKEKSMQTKLTMKYVIDLVKEEVVITRDDENRLKLYMLTNPKCIDLMDREMYATLVTNFVGLLTGQFDNFH